MRVKTFKISSTIEIKSWWMPVPHFDVNLCFPWFKESCIYTYNLAIWVTSTPSQRFLNPSDAMFDWWETSTEPRFKGPRKRRWSSRCFHKRAVTVLCMKCKYRLTTEKAWWYGDKPLERIEVSHISVTSTVVAACICSHVCAVCSEGVNRKTGIVWIFIEAVFNI